MKQENGMMDQVSLDNPPEQQQQHLLNLDNSSINLLQDQTLDQQEHAHDQSMATMQNHQEPSLQSPQTQVTIQQDGDGDQTHVPNQAIHCLEAPDQVPIGHVYQIKAPGATFLPASIIKVEEPNVWHEYTAVHHHETAVDLLTVEQGKINFLNKQFHQF